MLDGFDSPGKVGNGAGARCWAAPLKHDASGGGTDRLAKCRGLDALFDQEVSGSALAGDQPDQSCSHPI